MTNPDNIVRVRARTGGRASVYEANGWCQAFTQGLIEGTGVIQNTPADMNILVGGSAAKPDVVLAQTPSGYKVALDLVGQQAVTVTAPASNSRISAVVAYTDDLSLSTTQDTVTGSPASCGLIVVNGTTAANPSAPTDNQIRTAITADGATGSQAAYCVIATILVANNTTAIDNSLITIRHSIDSSFAFTQTGKITPTVSGGTIGNINDMYYALNSSGTVGKIYGRLRISPTTTGTITVTFPVSKLNVKSQFTIAGACWYSEYYNAWDILNARDMVVNTNGDCVITFSGLPVGSNVTMWLPACIYFFTDFGDVGNSN